jgi:iron complex outermembrane receptor protein
MARLSIGAAAGLVTAMAMTGACPASAQQDAAPGVPAANQGVPEEAQTLEDVIVTARKRGESLQDVPVAIDVVASTSLVRSGVASLQQISELAPAINLAKASSGSEIGVTVRGLGSAPGSASFDSSVSLFVDGVYAPRAREFATAMFDLERIEVVKGTQAALLGKNTSLGGINLVTRRPGAQFAVDARALYEFNLGSKLVSGGIDLPLSDTLAVRLAGQYNDEGGWVRNILTDRRNVRTRESAVRAVVSWEPTAAFDALLVAQHGVNRNYGQPAELVDVNDFARYLQDRGGAPGTLDGRLDRSTASTLNGGEPSERLRADRASLTANLHVGDSILTSVTGYSTYRDDYVSDVDYLAGDYLVRPVHEKSEQVSQEVRLVSPAGRRFEYVVGTIYIWNLLSNQTTVAANYPIDIAPGVPLVGTSRTDFHQIDRTASAFAQATFRLAQPVRLLGGLRYTRETKRADQGREAVVPGFYSTVLDPSYANFRQRRKETNVDYSVGVQYDLQSRIMAYASYGQGTKAGGFASNSTFLDDSEYGTERARTAELGMKAAAGRRWLVNLALFQTHVDDFQVVLFNGTNFDIFNTDLKSQGFEVQTNWQALDWLKLHWNNVYADAKDRRTGGPIPLAPKWSGAGGFEIARSLSPHADLRINGEVNYRSQRYYQQEPAISPPGRSFTTFNLSAAIAAPDDRWEVRLIGRNLTNADSAAFISPTPIIGAQTYISERPRTIAVQVSTRL